MSHETIAVVHPVDGVFLGVCLGLAFFSLLDNMGQDSATVFSGEEEAANYFQGGADYFAECRLIPLITAHPFQATYLELLCAGVDPRALNPLLRNQLAAALSPL